MGRSSDLPKRLSIVLVSFLFFFFCVSCNGLSGDWKSNSASSDRSLLSVQRRRDQRIFNCGEKVSALQCSQSPKFRWCRSDVIDDICFTRAEALRLPQQHLCETGRRLANFSLTGQGKVGPGEGRQLSLSQVKGKLVLQLLFYAAEAN